MSSLSWEAIDSKAVDTARVLAADAVEKVGNGHPGTAMSLAPVAYLLYQRVLRSDPKDDRWLGRDRFILSCGHSSLTQYIQLYLAGYGLELADIEALRTWGSLTPGHPEYRHTKGIEITTGPLGQGLASAVGFAYAARYERDLLDPEAPAGTSPFDHYVYVIASDGDLQEGVTSEASSLAGVQQLGNLIVLYDSNQISIEDDTNIAFTEDVAARYSAYGWHVQEVDFKRDGEYVEDVVGVYDAIERAKAVTDKPSIIVLKTIIGWPAPNKQNSGGIHGAKLGGEELAATKKVLGFDPEKHFDVAPEVIEHTRKAVQRGAEARAQWQQAFDRWAGANPERKQLLDRLEARELPENLGQLLPSFDAGKEVSTRSASGKVINALAPAMPELWGGSADLAGSNNTTIEGAKSFGPAARSTDTWTTGEGGRVLHFGIREHAMGAIVNGIVLHGPTRTYGGTFLVFSDYMRPAVRLAALMQIPSIYVWTHDSIGLGEDGPTHQPVEHLAALRAIPGLDVVRPADANEVAYAWLATLQRDAGPTGIVLSRQDLPVFERGSGVATPEQFGAASGVAKGAYVLAEAAGGTPQVILLASGSEVQLALEARDELQAEGVAARVVSVPCMEWFDAQSAEYRESVLPASITARVAVEAGIAMPWFRYVGAGGRCVSIEHFGASADYKTLFEKFGITAKNVAQAARECVSTR